MLTRLGRDEGVHAIVLPRTEAQRRFIESMALPSLIVPARAVEAQSLSPSPTWSSRRAAR